MRRTIFRTSAVKQYLQGRENEVLPRFVKPPMFVFLWAILLVLIALIGLVWSIRLPVYANGVAVIQFPDLSQPTELAMVFVPAQSSGELKLGQSVQLKDNLSGQTWRGVVVQVAPQLVSPAAIAKQFTNLAPLINQPCQVGTIRLEKPVASSSYANAVMATQLEVRNHSILALLPVLNKLLGE